MLNEKPPCNPYLVLTLGVTGVSFSAFLARLTTAPPLVISFWRLAFTCLLLIPLVYRDRAQFRALAKKDLLLSFASGLFLSFHFLFWFASLQRTSVSSATLLVNIHPLLLVTAGWRGRDKVGPGALPWALMAVVGIALLSWSGLRVQGVFLGNLLAVAGAFMLAAYYLTGRAARGRVAISIYAFLVYGSSALLLLGGGLATATPLLGYGPRDWLAFISLAAVPTICGHTLMNWTLKYLSASTVSISALGEPVLATLLAIPLLGEVPSPMQLAGGLLVIGGIGFFIKKSAFLS